MKNLVLILCIAAIAGVTSCTRTEEMSCGEGMLYVGLTGFATADLDSAIVIFYKKDNVFDSVIRTFPITVVKQLTDTAYIAPLYPSDPGSIAPGYFDADHDYKIYLPKLNRWYNISLTTLEGNTHQRVSHRIGSKADYGCTNQVKSCLINGNEVQAQRTGNFTELVRVAYVGK